MFLLRNQNELQPLHTNLATRSGREACIVYNNVRSKHAKIVIPCNMCNNVPAKHAK